MDDPSISVRDRDIGNNSSPFRDNKEFGPFKGYERIPRRRGWRACGAVAPAAQRDSPHMQKLQDRLCPIWMVPGCDCYSLSCCFIAE